jgi:uncharacterized protein YbgA (DUF1722 family)/uncharacterized protein YbbK (DUF523 family)
MQNSESNRPIKIGISACLTGQQVRFDKSHKKSNFCMNELAPLVEYKPFCPEVAVGMPVPRPTVRQVKRSDVIHVSRPDGSGDITDDLIAYGKDVAEANKDLSGFVFCAKSPSCGMERVKIYSEDGKGSDASGIGMFAKQIMEANPLLPCEENGRLNDSVLRENFVTRVFVYHSWQTMMDTEYSKKDLYEFHAKHKYLLMAHHVEMYRELGRLLAQSDSSLEELAHSYITGLMNALKTKATRKTHTNTLMHLMGYFKKHLTKDQKEELLKNIDGFRTGLLPLFAPITLLQHYLREYPNEYLQQQSYFSPHPEQLRLRYGY